MYVASRLYLQTRTCPGFTLASMAHMVTFLTRDMQLLVRGPMRWTRSLSRLCRQEPDMAHVIATAASDVPSHNPLGNLRVAAAESGVA